MGGGRAQDRGSGTRSERRAVGRRRRPLQRTQVPGIVAAAPAMSRAGKGPSQGCAHFWLGRLTGLGTVTLPSDTIRFLRAVGERRRRGGDQGGLFATPCAYLAHRPVSRLSQALSDPDRVCPASGAWLTSPAPQA